MKIYAYQCTWLTSFEGFLFYNWIPPVYTLNVWYTFTDFHLVWKQWRWLFEIPQFEIGRSFYWRLNEPTIRWHGSQQWSHFKFKYCFTQRSISWYNHWVLFTHAKTLSKILRYLNLLISHNFEIILKNVVHVESSFIKE